MKKALALLLLAAMLTAPLAGCDSSDDTPTQTTEGKGNSTTASTTADPNGDAASTTTVSPDDPGNDTPADPQPVSDFEYEVGEDGGITITKYIGTDTDVVIPEKIDGKDVTVIGSYVFSYANNSKVTSVDMPNTVKVIEGGAFMHNKELTTVRLSKSLNEINGGAFEGCVNLSTIQLPATLNKIDMRAFAECTSLKQIKIPKSVKEWYSESFAFCGLENVVLEEGLTILGETAFSGTNIKSIEIPGSVKVVPRGIFSRCKILETVILNEGIEAIDATAFRNSTSLTEIVIPDTVEKCSEFAFIGCTALTKVKFEGNAPSDFKNQDAGLEELYADWRATFTVYYHEGAEGFTTPEWNGYKTEIW